MAKRKRVRLTKEQTVWLCVGVAALALAIAAYTYGRPTMIVSAAAFILGAVITILIVKPRPVTHRVADTVRRADPKTGNQKISPVVKPEKVPELRPPATEMTAATYPAKGNVKTSTLPTNVRKLQMRNAVLLECLDSLGHGDMARDVIEELETEEK